jgi:hypothetical protein
MTHCLWHRSLIADAQAKALVINLTNLTADKPLKKVYDVDKKPFLPVMISVGRTQGVANVPFTNNFLVPSCFAQYAACIHTDKYVELTKTSLPKSLSRTTLLTFARTHARVHAHTHTHTRTHTHTHTHTHTGALDEGEGPDCLNGYEENGI